MHRRPRDYGNPGLDLSLPPRTASPDTSKARKHSSSPSSRAPWRKSGPGIRRVPRRTNDVIGRRGCPPHHSHTIPSHVRATISYSCAGPRLCMLLRGRSQSPVTQSVCGPLLPRSTTEHPVSPPDPRRGPTTQMPRRCRPRRSSSPGLFQTPHLYIASKPKAFSPLIHHEEHFALNTTTRHFPHIILFHSRTHSKSKKIEFRALASTAFKLHPML